MSSLKEGDRVRIVTRPVTDEDRKANRYFDHMAGLTGTVQNLYTEDQIAIRVDLDCLPRASAQVRQTANDRMRDKFLDRLPDEQRKQLTDEEINFVSNFVLLVRSADLEKA